MFKSPEPTAKERMLKASYLLDTTLIKLRNASSGLKKRDQMFLDKCIEAEMNDNHMKAVIYANECAEVRRLARLVMSSELAIEQAILRLKTISEVSNVMVAVNPILSVVQDTKGRLTGIIPSVADKLGEVNAVLRSGMGEIGSIYSPKPVVKSNGEALKILKEASEAAENRIRERFPELPQELEASEGPGIPVALTALGPEVNLEGEGLPEGFVKATSKLKGKRR